MSAEQAPSISDHDVDFYKKDEDLTVIIESGAIHIKAVTPQGDPVELNDHEAEELVRVLQRFIKRIR